MCMCAGDALRALVPVAAAEATLAAVLAGAAAQERLLTLWKKLRSLRERERSISDSPNGDGMADRAGATPVNRASFSDPAAAAGAAAATASGSGRRGSPTGGVGSSMLSEEADRSTRVLLRKLLLLRLRRGPLGG